MVSMLLFKSCNAIPKNPLLFTAPLYTITQSDGDRVLQHNQLPKLHDLSNLSIQFASNYVHCLPPVS